MGITQTGLAEIGNLALNDDTPNYFAYLGIGTDGTAFDIDTQSALITQNGSRVEATVSRITSIYVNDTMRFVGAFDITSSITIREVAICNALTGGETLARFVLTTPRAVTSGQTYTLIYDVPVTTT